MITLARANEKALEMIPQLHFLVSTTINADSEFFLAGIDKYKLTVVADDEKDEKSSHDYITVLPKSFFDKHVRNVADVLIYYMHAMGHNKCTQFWDSVTIPKIVFTQNEIRFLEEIYIQYLMFVVMPRIYSRHAKCLKDYNLRQIFRNKDLRHVLNSLLTKTPSAEVPEYLREIHKWLYTQNPLESKTFNEYVYRHASLIENTNFRELIKAYSEVLT